MAVTKEKVLAAFELAKSKRTPREPRFDQAMRFAMPDRGSFFRSSDSSDTEIDDVFDETAIIGVQEFASRLQSGITPMFSRWVSLTAGADVPPDLREEINTELADVTRYVFELLDQSNFASESYEAYLDLAVTLGALEVEEGTATEPVRFMAIPISELYILEGPFGRIDQYFRARLMTYEQFVVRFPDHKMGAEKLSEFEKSRKPWRFIQSWRRDWTDPEIEVHDHVVLCCEDDNNIVFADRYEGVGACPIIGFRWGKEAGSIWGRGPLLNVLPAVKTANLVMQMVLENAQMAIAGMYNMDDDGIVNPNTIELVPGTIIPRAPGSQGLEAVQPAGSFQIAEIVLSEQRANIKRGLYNDMLGNPDKTPMSAREVSERMADLARQIGSAFGRLIFEFLIPLMQRYTYLLKKRGLIKIPTINGREIAISATSPLAQAQNQADIQSVDRFVEWVQVRFGPQMVNVFVKGEEAVPYVAEKLQVPAKLVRKKEEIEQTVQQGAEMAQQAGMLPGGEQPAAAEGNPIV